MKKKEKRRKKMLMSWTFWLLIVKKCIPKAFKSDDVVKKSYANEIVHLMASWFSHALSFCLLICYSKWIRKWLHFDRCQRHLVCFIHFISISFLYYFIHLRWYYSAVALVVHWFLNENSHHFLFVCKNDVEHSHALVACNYIKMFVHDSQFRYGTWSTVTLQKESSFIHFVYNFLKFNTVLLLFQKIQTVIFLSFPFCFLIFLCVFYFFFFLYKLFSIFYVVRICPS